MSKKCLLEECEVYLSKGPTNKAYCSLAHRQMASYRRRRKQAFVCKLDSCSSEFLSTDSRKKYCSRSCAATANNLLRSARKGKRRCTGCDNVLLWSQEKFCSHKCSNDFKRNSMIQKWIGGEVTGSSSNGQLKGAFRTYLVDQAQHRCQSPTCAVPGGWSVPNPVTGKPILTVDHIDGNWKNNTIDNLIVLCYSCHTLTPTFGSLNKKSAGIRGSGNRAYKEYSTDRKSRERLDTSNNSVLE